MVERFNIVVRYETRREKILRRLNGRAIARRRYPNPMLGQYVGMGIGLALLVSLALFVPGDSPGGIAAMALRATVLLPLVKTGIITESQFMDWGLMVG